MNTCFDCKTPDEEDNFLSCVGCGEDICSDCAQFEKDEEYCSDCYDRQ